MNRELEELRNLTPEELRAYLMENWRRVRPTCPKCGRRHMRASWKHLTYVCWHHSVEKVTLDLRELDFSNFDFSTYW